MIGKIVINGLIGPVDDDPGVQLVDVIAQVKKQPEASEYKVFINSEGGNVDMGWKIYNYIKGLGKPITTIGQGIVASMATVIHLAGDTRRVFDNTRYMMHLPMLQVVNATANDLKEYAKAMEPVEKKMVDFYATTLGIERDTIKELLSEDTFLSQEQLKDFGIITAEPLQAVAKLSIEKPKTNEMSKLNKKQKTILGQIKALLSGAVAKIVYTAESQELNFPDLGEDDAISVGDRAIYEDGTAPEGEVLMEDGNTIVFESGVVIEIREASDNEDLESLQDRVEELEEQNQQLASAQAVLTAQLKEAKKDALNKKEVLQKLAMLESDIDGNDPAPKPAPRAKQEPQKKGSRASAALANLKKK